jgi:hypothetical protein
MVFFRMARVYFSGDGSWIETAGIRETIGEKYRPKKDQKGTVKNFMKKRRSYETTEDTEKSSGFSKRPFKDIAKIIRSQPMEQGIGSRIDLFGGFG